ncbi:Planctomycete cytochrome C [Aquisphaera giovannonii]|uniref:Planctomycete cytochrome C n=1 Tax=Aquisphaera giovannonii TaxID=406548 RepID=A0A5B9W2L3_9BACT|nr:PSD1 and planctomycete cytochrome C domain-containing protein [Aquisphaera giovannonii]QEH34843.1 Planctomycete cytochrome C [Aquisphaera giovannonii]
MRTRRLSSGPSPVHAASGFWALAAVMALGGVGMAVADDGTDYFEAKVRPVLVEHCYGCHSSRAKAVKGGLRLDSAEGVRKGGSAGPAVVAGKPEESPIVQAVRYDDEATKMPPRGKLPAPAIEAIERWVASGAAMPAPAGGGEAGAVKAAAAGASPKSRYDFAKARTQWAYRPIRRQAPPAVKDASWCRSPIDAFVLARLEAAGLSPSPEADRRTLLRRVTYDLIGLPPTEAELEAFEADRAEDAYAKVVDRLLASPRYGERWGRHWMDVARYADTKDGVLMFGDDRVRPYAYTYRDYVIRALNEDTPFDQFVREQIAGDVVAPADQPWRRAAMGFLTLGRMFDNNVHDQIDDKIDTVSRGLLGLTVSCARCHDHKYDAIPTADYYSLYGVFASSEAPMELPLTAPLEGLPGCAEFEKQAAAKRAEINKFLDEQYALLSETARKRVGDYLARCALTEPDPLETAIFFFSLAPDELRPAMVGRWRRYLKQRGIPDDPVFGPWGDLLKLSDAEFAAGAGAVIAKWLVRPLGTGPKQINPLVAGALRQSSIRARADVPKVYGDLIRTAYEASKARPPESWSGDDDASRAFRQVVEVVTSRESPAYFARSQTYQQMSRGEKDAFGGKLVELDRMVVKARDKAAPRAMVLNDAEALCDPRVFVRGNASSPGEPVPRRFLRVIAGDDPRPFGHGSGRLDLANAIVDPSNPLTARVLVNRVWMHHFGEPLVSTPSDFGTRSSPPTHPELLDDLAARFMQGGWSLKALHRTIVLSAAYRQSSVDRPEARKVDPENRLLWRANRRRLDLEAMRDTLLALSGRLDVTMQGAPVDVVDDPKSTRRTVYGLVDRQSVPAVFRAFDFASPDSSAERRPRTTVPQQALFSMNAPLVIEQARALAARPEVAAARSAEGKVEALYRRVLARKPDPGEREAATRFLAEAGTAARSQLDPVEQLAQVLLMTNELIFVD